MLCTYKLVNNIHVENGALTSARGSYVHEGLFVIHEQGELETAASDIKTTQGAIASQVTQRKDTKLELGKQDDP